MCNWGYLFNLPTGLAVERNQRKKEQQSNINNIQNKMQAEIKEMNETMDNNGEAIQTTSLKEDKLQKKAVSSLRLPATKNNIGLNI